MEVGINGRTFATDERGGPVQVGVEITSRLANCDDVNIHLFGAEELKTEFANSNVYHKWFINNQMLGLVWEQIVLPRLLNETCLDVLYCPNGNSPIKKIHIPTVVCIHDIMNYLGYSSKQYKYMQRIRLPRVLSTADIIVAISEFTKREISNHFPISPNKIKVVYNGVSDYFLFDSPGKPMDLPENYILHVGGFHPRKNIGNIYKAYNNLRDKIDNLGKLVIIGPGKKFGHSTPNLSLSKLEKDSDVVMKGFVFQQELKYAYNNANLFVFLSEYEGFGLPPLEAMACGTPVISSDKTAMPEILGDAAYFVDPNDITQVEDGIQSIIGDSELQTTLKIKGRNQARKYEWTSTTEKLRKVLNTAASSD